jgi:hypothetical protein
LASIPEVSKRLIRLVITSGEMTQMLGDFDELIKSPEAAAKRKLLEGKLVVVKSPQKEEVVIGWDDQGKCGRVEGGAEGLKLALQNLEFSLVGSHGCSVHIENHPGHFFLASNSLSLIIDIL